MHVEIDFEVYKALTFLRRDEDDSYNDVLRRLLLLSENAPPSGDLLDQVKREPVNILATLLNPAPKAGPGAWIGNVFFPDGTQFRATYKGRTFRAQIKGECWFDESGVRRQSPSEAAGAISGTKVNGWRFWYAKRPSDDDWRRLDEFRK